ncbi:DNA replication protein [Bifidobacterium longum]|nr:DNA replication protein [Bifidobacterium longum]
MNQKNGRTDPGPLRERARSLFISQATIDETPEWATPRQLDAIDRMLATEPANREASKRARLMRQARFPVPKSLDGYDFANVRLPDGYTKEQLTGLDFAAKAQDLVFYGKTGVLLQCLFDRFGSVFPQCGLMVFPGVVIVSR